MSSAEQLDAWFDNLCAYRSSLRGRIAGVVCKLFGHKWVEQHSAYTPSWAVGEYYAHYSKSTEVYVPASKVTCYCSRCRESKST